MKTKKFANSIAADEVVINPMLLGNPQTGHRQTVQNQIRCHVAYDQGQHCWLTRFPSKIE